MGKIRGATGGSNLPSLVEKVINSLINPLLEFRACATLSGRTPWQDWHATAGEEDRGSPGQGGMIS